MMSFENGKIVKHSAAAILAMGTGKSKKESAQIIELTKRLKKAEKQQEIWRELAIQTKQQLEEFTKCQ